MAHDHDESHECGLCGQAFDTEDDLKAHAAEAHDIED